jgi:hypothetical protein
MNKIKVLIDNGFITLQDVFDYVDSGAYLNSRAPEDDKDHMEWDDTDDYNQMIDQHEYDCEEQLNHDYTDDSYVEELRPKYVIASTNPLMEETMVFSADEHGDIISYGGLNSIALRYGHDNWQDAFAAVNQLNNDEYKYIHIKKIEGNGNVHNLFKRITVTDNVVI